MKKPITSLEEFDISGKLQFPHLLFNKVDINYHKNIAYLVISRELSDLLLISSFGFRENSVFAGLTEEHIEYIAVNAPKDYKENLVNLLRDQEKMKSVFEIAKAMDDDLGSGATKNQERVKNVIQYIKDNRMVFQF